MTTGATIIEFEKKFHWMNSFTGIQFIDSRMKSSTNFILTAGLRTDTSSKSPTLMGRFFVSAALSSFGSTGKRNGERKILGDIGMMPAAFTSLLGVGSVLSELLKNVVGLTPGTARSMLLMFVQLVRAAIFLMLGMITGLTTRSAGSISPNERANGDQNNGAVV